MARYTQNNNTTGAGRRVPARFGREIRFEVAPRFDTFHTDFERNTFEKLKIRLLKPLLNGAEDPGQRRQLRLAANEAAAIAWTTPVPLLVLPALLEEKADEVQSYTRRQEQVEAESRELTGLVLCDGQ